jgi:hypothetical protein
MLCPILERVLEVHCGVNPVLPFVNVTLPFLYYRRFVDPPEYRFRFWFHNKKEVEISKQIDASTRVIFVQGLMPRWGK